MTDLFEYSAAQRKAIHALLADKPPYTHEELEGRKARDQGIAKVLAHNPTWLDNAVIHISGKKWTLGPTFTGEDLRCICDVVNISPKHPNGWGALVSTLAKRGIIEKTGEYTQMRQKSSHARETALWRFV